MPYVKRTTKAGKTIEVEYYYTSRYNRKGQGRGDKVKATREEQKKVNTRQAERKLRLLLNNNYGYGDYHVVLDYIRVKGKPDRTKEEMDVSHITIRNVKTGGRHHGIICLAANGCQVHHIHIENISEDSMGAAEPWREATVKIYTGYGRDYTPGDLHHITVENVHGVYANNALYCNAQVENVVLKNITHDEDRAILLDYPEGITVCE